MGSATKPNSAKHNKGNERAAFPGNAAHQLNISSQSLLAGSTAMIGAVVIDTASPVIGIRPHGAAVCFEWFKVFFRGHLKIPDVQRDDGIILRTIGIGTTNGILPLTAFWFPHFVAVSATFFAL